MSILKTFLGTAIAAGCLLCASCNPGLNVKKDKGDSTPGEEGVFQEVAMGSAPANVIVLAYRDIVTSYNSHTDPLDISLYDLQDEILKLSGEGATFVSMDDLYEHITEGKKLPFKAAVITFDDARESVFKLAFPMLYKNKIPFAVFARSESVSATDESPRMSPQQLRDLADSGFCSVGAETASFPADITKIPFEEQKTELADSKKALEASLKQPVKYFAWPNGARDPMSVKLARDAGYLMGFTLDQGVASLSSSVLEVRRWTADRFKEALQDLDDKYQTMPSAVSFTINDTVVTSEETKIGICELALVRGGKPQSVLIEGRASVNNIVNRFGGVAGMNGGFFLIAALDSSDNRMIGPCMPSNTNVFTPDSEPVRLKKLTGRPMVIFDDLRVYFVPFRPAVMNDQRQLQKLVPKMTDAFMAGAWLVHKGKPMTRGAMQGICVQDAFDFRRRAFFGISQDGEVVMGACLGSFRSDQVAEAAAKAGCVEAVLLDSGFSTSLVIADKILASGHSSKNEPSRPIPHAIVIKGTLSPKDSPKGTGEEEEEGGTAPASESGERWNRGEANH